MWAENAGAGAPVLLSSMHDAVGGHYQVASRVSGGDMDGVR